MFNREVSSYMTLVYDFDGIRVLSHKLTPVQWQLEINLAGLNNGLPEDTQKYQESLSVNYQKIYMWLEYFMSDIVLVGYDENLDDFIGNYDNQIVQLPNVPTDDVFIEALHSKISVLAGPDMLIGELTLTASDTRSKFHFSTISGEGYHLPSQDAWVDIEYAVFDTPWWTRHDCDTYEPYCDADSNKEELREAVDTSKILDTIVKDIEDALGYTEDESGDLDIEAEIIQLKPKFKPKLVP